MLKRDVSRGGDSNKEGKVSIGVLTGAEGVRLDRPIVRLDEKHQETILRSDGRLFTQRPTKEQPASIYRFLPETRRIEARRNGGVSYQ